MWSVLCKRVLSRVCRSVCVYALKLIGGSDICMHVHTLMCAWGMLNGRKLVYGFSVVGRQEVIASIFMHVHFRVVT